VKALRKEFDARNQPGFRRLTTAALYRMTGLRGQAAIATSGNAQVNPVRACEGFLAAAARRGANIFERSHVRGVKASRSGVEVRTAGGTISAACIVVATGYATPEFRGLVGRFRMKDTYVLATRRLSGPRRRRVMAWDTDRPYHYLRWSGDGRLLVGGKIHATARQRAGRRCGGAGRGRTGRIYGSSPMRREYLGGLFAETPAVSIVASTLSIPRICSPWATA
jgi:glycine/D-amino acid oxidase-like deaminating enzyme